MSSLANLPEVIGFFSYSREDDEAFEGTLSALREGIQRELSAQLGRSKATFRLWQDQVAIAPGQLWESEIKAAVEQAVFFIPIVTPRAVNSHHCKFEFEAFLARERALDRNDLVFPLLYIGLPALEDEAQWRKDPVLSTIGTRQYVDWRPFRHRDVHEPAVREAIERFCSKIVEALRRPWASPEERRKQQEIEAQQRAKAARQAEDQKWLAEAARRAEEEERRAGAARQAAEKKRRVEAVRQAAEEMRVGKPRAGPLDRQTPLPTGDTRSKPAPGPKIALISLATLVIVGMSIVAVIVFALSLSSGNRVARLAPSQPAAVPSSPSNSSPSPSYTPVPNRAAKELDYRDPQTAKQIIQSIGR
jgi:TIR domain